MKKVICLVLVIMVLLAINAPLGFAERGGHGGGGHGGHGHSSFSGSVWIGPGWGGWGGWGWGYSYPYYPYYPNYPYYYSEPPVVMERQAPAYVEPSPQAEEDYYWYFCPDSKNYYPYVKRCPSGWLRVVPRQTPPDWKE